MPLSDIAECSLFYCNIKPSEKVVFCCNLFDEVVSLVEISCSHYAICVLPMTWWGWKANFGINEIQYYCLNNSLFHV